MRGVAAVCVFFCLSGCQSGSPDLTVATPAPTPAIAIAMARPETREPRQLNQPPAPRAKALAQPHDPFQAKPAPVAKVNIAAHPQLPRPGYPVHQPPTTVPGVPSVAPGMPSQAPGVSSGASGMPPAVGTQRAPSPAFSPRSAYVPPTPTSAYNPPTLPRFEPGRGSPVTGAPRLPGQAAPPPFSTPLGDRRIKERELEQAYLQSRADALNLKYHGGRAVLNAQSPQVMTSAIAPPAMNMPPSIPGTYGVVDAFKASEAKRQDWQSYRSMPPVMPSAPAPVVPQYQPPMPQPPRPSFP